MILTSLLQAAELPVSATGWKLSPNNGETAIRSAGKSGTPRTCRELRATDPSLPSGMHWIDPDGQGLDNDPIYTFIATWHYQIKCVEHEDPFYWFQLGKRIKTNLSFLVFGRIDIHFTRQWIFIGCGSLRRPRVLFTINQLQRVHWTDESFGQTINWMSSISYISLN